MAGPVQLLSRHVIALVELERASWESARSALAGHGMVSIVPWTQKERAAHPLRRKCLDPARRMLPAKRSMLFCNTWLTGVGQGGSD